MFQVDVSSKNARICFEIDTVGLSFNYVVGKSQVFSARFPSDSLISNIQIIGVWSILLLFADWWWLPPRFGDARDISNTVGIALASHGFAKKSRCVCCVGCVWGDGDSHGESSQTQRAGVKRADWCELPTQRWNNEPPRATDGSTGEKPGIVHAKCLLASCNWKHQKISENITNHGCKSALSAWDLDFLRTKNTGNRKPVETATEPERAPRSAARKEPTRTSLSKFSWVTSGNLTQLLKDWQFIVDFAVMIMFYNFP